MSAAHFLQFSPAPTPKLYVALELAWGEWNLAFTTGMAQSPRLRTIPARDILALALEIQRAKERFRLPEDTSVLSCYEAGRDGFWLHRCLISQGVQNLVVDSASIEVNRRKRRAKSDRLDGTKLATMLIRWDQGETKLWGVVQVPSAEDEDGRQLHREMIGLKDERTSHINRIKGFLAGLGLALAVDLRLPQRLDGLRQWDGSKLPADLRARILREFDRWQLVDIQIRSLETEQRRRVRDDATPGVESIRRLLGLKGVGVQGAWLLVREFLGWRQFRNRRQVGGLAGLTGTPYASGSMEREQGISKAGNRRLRWLMVELAWSWLRYQPESVLSRWYHRRFHGSARLRKIGIVALARKLLVAFWKYLKREEVPEGAVVVPWPQKISSWRAAKAAAAVAC
jgi:transposase